MLSAIPNFPWSLAVPIMVIAVSIILRSPLSALMNRIIEVKGGPAGFKIKTEAQNLDPALIKEVQEIVAQVAAAGNDLLDSQRLVIRDSKGRAAHISYDL